jgi:hypothetical protein
MGKRRDGNGRKPTSKQKMCRRVARGRRVAPETEWGFSIERLAAVGEFEHMLDS